MTGTQASVSSDDLRMLEKLSPRLFGNTYLLPPSKLFPDERKRRRLAFRNERNLYRRKCDLTGANIVSAYSPDKTVPVFSREAWWSDGWDPMVYGKEFDFNRPFFEQFFELQRKVPRMALITTPDAEEYNCTYVNFAGCNKNSYLIFDSDFNEDSYYSNVLKHSRNCVDCSYVHSSEICYECVDCSSCYELCFSQDCANCHSSMFLNNCIGCSECFFCCNLKNKRYYINNKPHTKEDYEQILSSYDVNSYSGLCKLKGDFDSYARSFPKKYSHIVQAENCTGGYIRNAKNCQQCFNISDGEDLLHCDSLYGAKDCMDVSSFGEKIEHVYESGTIGIDDCYVWFSFASVQNCSNILYCIECRFSQCCFGCVSLKRKKYCILNKQYTEDEYQKLLPKVISHLEKTGEWGEFFPMSHSAFGYNESVASEYFPLSMDEAFSRGANWSDYEAPAPDVAVIGAGEVPERIDDTRDDILGTAICCERTGRAFRVNEQELRFYRRLSLPLPKKHPDRRHAERMEKRNPQKLWTRECEKTGERLLSTYSPAREESILCEKAFLEVLE